MREGNGVTTHLVGGKTFVIVRVDAFALPGVSDEDAAQVVRDCSFWEGEAKTFEYEIPGYGWFSLVVGLTHGVVTSGPIAREIHHAMTVTANG